MGPERPEPGRAGREGGWQPSRARRIWHTDDVPHRERFAYYRDAICEAFMELVPEREAGDGSVFGARVESLPIADGAVNRVRSSPHLVRRTRTEIARSPDACYYLNLQLGGVCVIRQDGNELRLSAGRVGIFDSAQPFTLLHPTRQDLHVASFWVPQDRFSRLGLDPPDLAGRMLSDHPRLGLLIVEAARTLVEAGSLMEPAETEALFDSLICLSAVAARAANGGGSEDGAGDAAPERRAFRPALLRAILAHIDRQLDDPGLSVEAIAARFGIGKRYLHRLFEATGTTVANHIADRRLDRVAARLAHPGSRHLTVAAIAYGAGFGDLSGFNRRFRARFGCTPRELRDGI